MLQRERNRGGKGVHQPGDRGTFLGHLDEDLTRLAIGVKADGDVALVPGNRELMGEGGAFFRQAMTDRAGRTLVFRIFPSERPGPK